MQIYSNKLFKNPIEIIEIFNPEELSKGFEILEKLVNKGLYLLGYFRYDLTQTSKMPLMYFEAYENYSEFSEENIDKKIGIITKSKITKEDYEKAFLRVKDEISNGNTYEVNLTYPFEVKTNAEDFELYQFLLKKQKTKYNAFLKNKYETILSFSPEMFFTLKGKKIFTKPMKGTMPRGKDEVEDLKNKEFLHNDIKNRAENVMIVDLLRNDLGKIAKAGSVKVDKLFDIEAHKTVFQMTSEISAQLKDEIKLVDVFNSIFPCGSITGAPKISTMRIIQEVEQFPREVYCGAIGYLHKDFAEFSVPIRILQKKNNEKHFTYHSGGAVVWNSKVDDELEETITKTKFLETEFSLIETAIDEWEMHLERMKNSAKELGFKWNFDIEKIQLEKDKVTRVELLKNGEFVITHRDLPSKIANPVVKIDGRVETSNPFLYHKTSVRKDFPQGYFDKIQTNERGEITEGIFTNVGILKDGNYYTPPVSSGLLNGIYRKKLNWQEKVLYPKDLETADKIYCFNSVRGLVEVKLC